MRIVATFFAVCFVICNQASAAPAHLYVASDGSDSWSGTLASPNAQGTDGPFATLEQARDAVRALKVKQALPQEGAVILVRGGDYYRETSFLLGPEDSAPEGGCIRYAAYPDEHPRLLGGKPVGPFVPVSDATVLAHFQEFVWPHLVQADLSKLGIKDYGSPAFRRMTEGESLPSRTKETGHSARDSDDRPLDGELSPMTPVSFFYGGDRMTLCRWPNAGYDLIMATPGGQNGATIVLDSEFPRVWASPSEAYVWGYFAYDWFEGCLPVKSFDATKNLIETRFSPKPYGFVVGARVYLCNVLEELDQPGEYYIDRAKHTLYFYPPATSGKPEAYVSITTEPLVSLQQVKNVAFSGLTFEYASGSAVTMKDCSLCVVEGCSVANSDGVAVAVTGGEKVAVRSCDMHNLGAGGILLKGGDRQALTPCDHEALNNHIWDFAQVQTTYQPAIHANGVGVRIAHNLIHHSPHSGIIFWGNDHVMEFNDIHHVLLDTHDCGAIYTGRSWTYRGNRISNNFIHHIGRHNDRHAVYLDDMFSSADIVGNVFWNLSAGILVGGGRDNAISNNIFADCSPAVSVDDRGTAGEYMSIVKGRLKEVPYNKPPYSTRYPALVTILKDKPELPKGNSIVRNIGVETEPWINAVDYLTKDGILAISDNFTQGDPGFLDAAHGDFRLKPDAPARSIGFEPIPFEQVGLYKDAYRTELPAPDAFGAFEEVPEILFRRAAKNEPPHPCPRTTTPVAIDGKLDDWDAFPVECKEPSQVYIRPDSWKGPEDCRFRFGTKYDDHYLYVAVQVLDDKVKTYPKRTTWSQDGVELRLDARPKDVRDLWCGQTENKETVTIILSPGQTAADMVGLDPSELPDGVQAVCVLSAGGYSFEAAIPVSYLEKKQGAPWTGFRMNVAVDDTDKPQDGLAQLAWMPDWRRSLNYEGSGEFERGTDRPSMPPK